jgi:hypothetical protein
MAALGTLQPMADDAAYGGRCPKDIPRDAGACLLEIDMRHARTMCAVARAAWSGSQRRCVKLT